MRKHLIEYCHGCAREVYLAEPHWVVVLVTGERVFFHNGCYKHYKEVFPKKIGTAKEKW